jgi:general stress protein 26
MASDAQDPKRHLEKLIEGFHTAMLVTRSSDGALRSRPLALAEVHDQGTLYFATSVDSAKVAELEKTPGVAVTLQASDKYISVTGDASVSRDRALIERLWSEAWKVWFPGGKDDPSLSIITVTPHAAEYWDQTGLKGIKYLFEAATAYAPGTTPESGGSSENAKVRM